MQWKLIGVIVGIGLLLGVIFVGGMNSEQGMISSFVPGPDADAAPPGPEASPAETAPSTSTQAPGTSSPPPSGSEMTEAPTSSTPETSDSTSEQSTGSARDLRSIRYGETKDGTVDPSDQPAADASTRYESVTFTGERGDTVGIDVSTDGDTTGLELQAPTGEIVTSNMTDGSSYLSIDRTLNKTGEYTIRISGRTQPETTNFTLSLERFTTNASFSQLASETTDDLTSSPNVTIDIDHRSEHPQQASFTLRYEIPENVSALSLDVPKGTEITAREGFSRSLEWDRTTNNPSVTFTTKTDDESYSGYPPGREFVGTDDWLLTKPPIVSDRWKSGGVPAKRMPFAALEKPSVTLSSDTEAVVGDRFLYVGPYTEYTHNASGQHLRLIEPDAANLNHRPREILQSIEEAGNLLHVGGRDAEILMIAGPDPIREGGLAYGDELLVGDGGFLELGPSLESANNVWLHEYVHTRQSYHLSPRMRWFDEGSAEYYAALLTYHQENIEGSDAVTHLRPSEYYCEETLSEFESWESEKPLTEYRKGSAVLYALDQRIRNTTNYRQDLTAVFREMNSREGRITYAEFKEIVQDVSGTSMDDWLDRYVTSSECPPLSPGKTTLLSGNGRIHSVSLGGDVDGDGRYSNVTVSIRADTTIEDAPGDSEPRITLTAGNYTIAHIEDPGWGANQRHRVRVNESTISWFEGRNDQMDVTVSLWEDDVLRDELVDTYSQPVAIEPAGAANRSCQHTLSSPSLRIGMAVDDDGDNQCSAFILDVRVPEEEAEYRDIGSSDPIATVEVDGHGTIERDLEDQGDTYGASIPVTNSHLPNETGVSNVSIRITDDDPTREDELLLERFALRTEEAQSETASPMPVVSDSGDDGRNASLSGDFSSEGRLRAERDQHLLRP